MRVKVKTAEEDRGGLYRLRDVAALALMLVAALLLASCGGEEEPQQVEEEVTPAEEEVAPTEGQEPPEQAAGVTISEILEEPDEYYGQSVTVQGAVARVFDPNVFAIVDQQAMQENNELFDDPETLAERSLLVAGKDVPNLVENETVQVAGTVQPYDIAVFEDALVIDVEPNETFNFFEGRAAIVADSVQPQGGETTMQMQETTSQ